jgi:hypothetical protein
MTARKIDWSLSPTERELLRRDCEASKVPIAVEDPNAIKRIVGLITKAGDRRARAAAEAPSWFSLTQQWIESLRRVL